MRAVSIFVYFAYFLFVFADEDDVHFPENYGYKNRNQANSRMISSTQTPRTIKSIPLDLIQKLNSFTNEEEFIRFIEPAQQFSLAPSLSRMAPSFQRDGGGSVKRFSRLTDARHLARDTEIEPPQIALAYATLGSVRLGDGAVNSRSGIVDSVDGQNRKNNGPPFPKPANCQPELRTVNLRDNEDPTLYYFPSCTRVDRCGGCCSHDLLSCQPMLVEYKNFSVIVSQYTGGQKLEPRGKKVVTVETHTKCKCDCRIKPKDCTSLQEYKKSDCRCVCTNKDDEMKCAQDKTRLWNPSTCSCQCRESADCGTGLSFDENTCSCQPFNRRPPQFPPDYKVGYRPEQ